MENITTTILSTTLFLTSALSAPVAPTQEVAFTRVLSDKDYVGHVVQKEASLSELATELYGSDAYWTILWNDNTWIADPEAVEKDKILKIRIVKPVLTEELDANLAGKNSQLTQEKNAAYLERIGYSLPAAVQAQPTVVPAKPAAAANAASPISEEAITYLGNCEAGMNPTRNTGNGYYGAFQFSQGTWNRMNTGYARADLAPLEVQKAAVKQLLSQSSIYGQFPGCAKKMRSAGLI